MFALSAFNLALAITYLGMTVIKPDSSKANANVMGGLNFINHLFDFFSSVVFLWIWQHYIGHVEKKIKLQRESTIVGLTGDGQMPNSPS